MTQQEWNEILQAIGTIVLKNLHLTMYLYQWGKSADRTTIISDEERKDRNNIVKILEYITNENKGESK